MPPINVANIRLQDPKASRPWLETARWVALTPDRGSSMISRQLAQSSPAAADPPPEEPDVLPEVLPNGEPPIFPEFNPDVQPEIPPIDLPDLTGHLEV